MKNFKMAITERGEPAFDRTFENRLQQANIIITKNVEAISDILLRHHKKIILHSTITGYGGTSIERNVPSYHESLSYLTKLIKNGFPTEQIVLRVDPIFPTQDGISVAQKVINESLSMLDIKRIRFSFLDVYPHVIKRFETHKLENMLPTKDCESHKNQFLKFLENISNKIEISSCAENTRFKKGCVSYRDLELLGISNIVLNGSSNQRRGCLCLSNKYELLKEKARCPHGCLYCYWHDAKESEQHSIDFFFNEISNQYDK